MAPTGRATAAVCGRAGLRAGQRQLAVAGRAGCFQHRHSGPFERWRRSLCQPIDAVAQRAAFDWFETLVWLGLGRAGFCALHDAVHRPPFLRDSGQRAQPAAALGGGVGRASGALGVRRRCLADLACQAMARARCHAADGLERAGLDFVAQLAGVPAVVRAVPDGGAAVRGVVVAQARGPGFVCNGLY